jgi:hypothetical protein
MHQSAPQAAAAETRKDDPWELPANAVNLKVQLNKYGDPTALKLLGQGSLAKSSSMISEKMATP